MTDRDKDATPTGACALCGEGLWPGDDPRLCETCLALPEEGGGND